MLEILRNVLALELPHALDLVQVHDEAIVFRVIQLNALATENRLVVAAIKVLHSLRMLGAELSFHSLIRLLKR